MKALQSYGLHSGSQFVAAKTIVQNPGPGNYEPSVKTAKGKINPAWSVPKEDRDKVYSKPVPGPGDYTLPPKIGEAPRYLMGLKLERNSVKDQASQPGPLDYSPIKSQKSLHFSMSGKHDRTPSPDKITPGPGAYRNGDDTHYRSLAGSKIGTDSRQSYFLKSASF